MLRPSFVLLTSAFFLVLGLSTPARGAEGGASEVDAAKQQLDTQLFHLNSMRAYVERHDLGRLNILQRADETVRQSIDAHGLRHVSTMREYQNLIVAYRFSADFLRKITTERTAPSIFEIQRITADITAAVGFDESPYTTVTVSVFQQIHQLVESLLKLPLDARLEETLKALVPDLGQAIAIGGQGDQSLRTIQTGMALYYRIRGLYPEFDRVAFANAAFEIVINIQGLNEFYGEYAKLPLAPTPAPQAPAGKAASPEERHAP